MGIVATCNAGAAANPTPELPRRPSKPGTTQHHGSGKKPHVRKILSAMLPHPSLETDMADPAENLALGWFEKLCFGTDNPEPDRWVPAAEFILDRLEIPEETRRKFYYDNAAKLLGL